MTAARYLLDTNALIGLRDALRPSKPRDAARQQRIDRIRERCKAIPSHQLAMSFISLGELSYGAEKSSDPAKNHALINQLRSKVQTDTGLPSGQAEAMAQKYGELRAHLERQGKVIGPNDMWIAAHALALDLTLVTRDIGAFNRVPHLRCEDWTA